MISLYFHRDNPEPGVISADVIFFDPNNLSTGQFINQLDPVVWSKTEPTRTTLFQVPNFQIVVTIIPLIKQITVLLGRADGSRPTSHKSYRIPNPPPRSYNCILEVYFEHMQVTRVTLNGVQLTELPWI